MPRRPFVQPDALHQQPDAVLCPPYEQNEGHGDARFGQDRGDHESVGADGDESASVRDNDDYQGNIGRVADARGQGGSHGSLGRGGAGSLGGMGGPGERRVHHAPVRSWVVAPADIAAPTR